MPYKNKDWKDFLSYFGINNKDIANTLGINEHAVNIGVSDKINKGKMPKWAKLALWTWEQMKQKQSEKDALLDDIKNKLNQ